MRRTLLVLVGVGVVATAVSVWKLPPALRDWLQSRQKLIEDFDEAGDTNRIGGERAIQGSPEAQLSWAVIKTTPAGPDGLSCAITYDLRAGATGAWATGLNALDISAARAIRFRMKAGQPMAPEVHVELVDSGGQKAQVTLARRRVSTRWRQVSIPLDAFPGVDLNRLAGFALRVSAPDRALQGTLHLDDLLFVGPSHLFFRSLKDNLYGFPRRPLANASRLLALPRDAMLRALAEDTWGYFRDAVDRRHHLPLNYVQTRPTPLIGDYASTTDVSLYLMSVVSAADLGFIDRAAAVTRIQGTLKTLARLATWRHFFYNYYSTTNLQVANQYISSVDNGWLAVALIIIRQAFPELAEAANGLLEPMDFDVFYDPQNGQIRLGYDIKEGRFSPYHYGLLATEARIISVVAIGKGDLPAAHWFKMFRTLPKEWTWQRQAPQGRVAAYDGHEVFQGFYLYDDGQRQVPFVPSWGGSLFEFLMPTLVVDERRLAPAGLGLNDQRAVEFHIRYALNERRFPVWGLSPCATPQGRHGGYSEFGVAALGSKGYKDEAIVTPHASFLALPFAPEAVHENLRQFLRRYPMYGPYGLYDSVDVEGGHVAYRYLALDQGMSLIALANHLTGGAIPRRFSADPVMSRVEPLLRMERLFDHDETARTNGQ